MKTISRKEAKKLGLKRYFTSNPCKYGHISERSTANGSCLECCRVKANSKRLENVELARFKEREYYRKNAKERRKALRVWRSSNKEKANAQCKRYRDKNRDRIREYDRKLSIKRDKEDPKVRQRKLDHQRRNKAYYNMKANERRAAKMKSIPLWYNRGMVKKVYQKAKELNLTVDHVVPIQSSLVCGLHCWHNLQLLDQSANSSKGNHYWPDMP
tara:strand:- start:11630 stop:12271 length:642 start_codon:yes stop_codon:yes gene_type:complete